MSLGVGSGLVLRIEPEFGVRSCVTRSHNTYLYSMHTQNILPNYYLP